MNELQLKCRQVSMIGGAFIFMIIIYAVAVEYITLTFTPFSGFGKFPASAYMLLKYFFFAVALIQFFLIRYYKAFVLANKTKSEDLLLKLLSAAIVADLPPLKF